MNTLMELWTNCPIWSITIIFTGICVTGWIICPKAFRW